jgi:hypothetical protein
VIVLCIRRWVGDLVAIGLRNQGGGNEGHSILVLSKSDSPEVFARQLARAVDQLEKGRTIYGITSDLQKLCLDYDVPLNIEWKVVDPAF